MNFSVLTTLLAVHVTALGDHLTNGLNNLQLKFLENPQLFDAVSSATGTINQLTGGVRTICFAGAALSFAFGAGQYLTGGDESMRKAKHRWIGAGVGLVVAVGATVIRDYIQSKANF